MVNGFRDANLLIIHLSTHQNIVQVGLGVSPDTISPPALILPITAYVKADLINQNQSNSNHQVLKLSDYSFEPKPDLIPLEIFSNLSNTSNTSTNSTKKSSNQISENHIKIDWKALDGF
ncbi:hypothetical protein O181_106703, partial [Austropuccinia psidii MF-1]|nr:hypothetical protein [Austropuccinia psidii MF-1]